MNKFIQILVLSVVITIAGCKTDQSRCENKCAGSNDSCMFLFIMLMSYPVYDNSYTQPITTIVNTEYNDSTNGFFNSAEQIYTPGYNTVRFNAVINIPDDIDIYYLSALYGTEQFNIKQISGTATCELYKSSVQSSSSNLTDTADIFMENIGLMTTTGTDITLDSSYPFLYIKCTDSVFSTYSFEFTTSPTTGYFYEPAYDYTQEYFTFINLICSGSEGRCVESCLSGD